ncbi:MAG: hypothetical protein Q8P02_05440 [Candidatus Micrarchaeota archaeon]|nr:hypothetical protein [Candidatus Micrarchaeota archaeon]
MDYSFTAYRTTCAACREIISRTVAQFPGAHLKSLDLDSGLVVLECDEKDASAIQDAVFKRGYGPLSDASAKSVLGGVLGNDSAFAAERKILEYSLFSFFIVFPAVLFLAWILSAGSAAFWTVWAPLGFLSSASICATMAAFSHLSFFRTRLSDMTGMMVGMTVGMSAGFLFGALVGATNGMFVGSLAGMAVGMGLGAWAGRCCGVMGVMEGLMAGLMSGTMGAMISVMMLAEPILLFLVILFVVCVAILAGLSFAVFREAGTISQESFRPSFASFAAVSLLAGVFLTLLMVAGPKSTFVLGV